MQASLPWFVEHTKWVHSIHTLFSALWHHLHSRQSRWCIQVCNKLLTPPRPCGWQGRPVSDWWALLSFIFDSQLWPAGDAIHLMCHGQITGVMLWKKKAGLTNRHLFQVFFVSEYHQGPSNLQTMIDSWSRCFEQYVDVVSQNLILLYVSMIVRHEILPVSA